MSYIESQDAGITGNFTQFNFSYIFGPADAVPAGPYIQT